MSVFWASVSFWLTWAGDLAELCFLCARIFRFLPGDMAVLRFFSSRAFFSLARAFSSGDMAALRLRFFRARAFFWPFKAQSSIVYKICRAATATLKNLLVKCVFLSQKRGGVFDQLFHLDLGMLVLVLVLVLVRKFIGTIHLTLTFVNSQWHCHSNHRIMYLVKSHSIGPCAVVKYQIIETRAPLS